MNNQIHQTNFIYQGDEPTILLSYDLGWVFFSVLLAVLGATVGIAIARLSRRIDQVQTRILVQLTGAAVFGSAVWSMHFVGMLAVSMPLKFTYDPVVTITSVVPAIVSAWFAIRWISKRNKTQLSLIITATIIALGIGVMHYTGMLAMQMDAHLKFEVTFFTLSIILAFLFSYLGMWLQQQLGELASFSTLSVNIASGLCLGLAITAMHYVAMLSTRIVGAAVFTSPLPAADRAYLGIIIGIGIFAALGIGFSGALLSRLRFSIGELQFRKNQLTSIVSQSMHSIITVDQHGIIESTNPQTEHLFRATPEQMVGHNIRRFIPDWNPNIKDLKQNGVKNRESQGSRTDGSTVPIVMRKSLLREANAFYFVIFLMDISEYKDAEQELYYQATHDSLTGLYNRRHMEGSALREYNAIQRHQRALSVVMLDIDHFKKVNDTYGHDIGDKVLMSLAKTLESKLRRTDLLYRCGGEEFVILFPETEAAEAYMLANKLCKTISNQSIYIDDKISIQVSVSMGVYTANGTENGGYEEMIQRADRAMYAAKSSGRNRVVAYTPEHITMLKSKG